MIGIPTDISQQQPILRRTYTQPNRIPQDHHTPRLLSYPQPTTHNVLHPRLHLLVLRGYVRVLCILIRDTAAHRTDLRPD